MPFYEKLCAKMNGEYSNFLKEIESVDTETAKTREEERIVKKNMVDTVNNVMISEDLSERLYASSNTLQTLFSYWHEHRAVNEPILFETTDFIYNCALSLVPFIKEEKQTAIDNGFVDDLEKSLYTNTFLPLTILTKKTMNALVNEL